MHTASAAPMLGRVAPAWNLPCAGPLFSKFVDAFLEALFGVVLEFLGTILGVLIEAALEALIQPLLGFVLHLLWSMAFWTVAVPVCYTVYTPVLLVWSLFGPGTYGRKVADGYRKMTAALPEIANWS